MIFSHGYAASLARQRKVAAHKVATETAKNEAVTQARSAERERWLWFSKPQHENEVWLPTKALGEQRRIVVPLVPRSVSLRVALRRSVPTDSICARADFEAVPMAWEAPNGQLVRWFDWRPCGYEPIQIREYERKQMIARWESEKRRSERRGFR